MLDCASKKWLHERIPDGIGSSWSLVVRCSHSSVVPVVLDLLGAG